MPLENGDRLASTEFLRRYEGMPELKKAELVDGIVHTVSPVSRIHAKPDALIQLWIGYYAAQTAGVEHLPNATIILSGDNTPQPDCLLRLLPEFGGSSTITEKNYVSGPPELVVEIAASSASIDLHDKLRAYQRHKVPEYIVWLVAERAIKWFLLEDDQYLELRPDARGTLRSRVFPGLILAVQPALDLEGAAVLTALEKGLASTEHAAFINQLKHAKSRTRLRQKSR